MIDTFCANDIHYSCNGCGCECHFDDLHDADGITAARTALMKWMDSTACDRAHAAVLAAGITRRAIALGLEHDEDDDAR